MSLTNEVNNVMWLDDAPSDGTYTGAISYNFSATDYIMFAPAGGIFVTLSTVTWSTDFGASYPSATIDPNKVVAPGALQPSDSFPTWTQTWSNPNTPPPN